MIHTLGDLEADIMVILWEEDQARTVREIRQLLEDQRRDLAYTTVLTVVERLFRKGYLLRQERGRAFAYEAAVTRDQHTARLMNEALGTSPDRAAALVSFAGRLSEQEAAVLRQALAEAAAEESERQT